MLLESSKKREQAHYIAIWGGLYAFNAAWTRLRRSTARRRRFGEAALC